VDAEGNVYVADGTHLYTVMSGGKLRTLGMMFGPGYPGSAPLRGLFATGVGEFIATTANGQVARYRPATNESELLAEGLDQLYGVAATSSGAVVAAELGAGRVVSVKAGKVETLATGLRDPIGVAIDADGTCFVSEASGGRVVKLNGSRVATVLDGLERPQGIAERDGELYVVDVGARSLILHNLKSKSRHTIATDLPVGAPIGITPKPLRGLPPFSGPQGPFAGIAIGPNGTVYVSGDAEGSVLALRRAGEKRKS
jgi:glucose/arabinose dehydrogenase